MTTYQLKEIIHSKYNRNDVGRYHRAILFLIENTVSGESSLFQIDRISKNTCSLRCNNRKCKHRLTITHDLPTEQTGKKNRIIASSVTKEDLMKKENWFKCFHDHTAKCTKTGPFYCDKTEHNFRTCSSKSTEKIIGRKFRSYCVHEKVAKPESAYNAILACPPTLWQKI